MNLIMQLATFKVSSICLAINLIALTLASAQDSRQNPTGSPGPTRLRQQVPTRQAGNGTASPFACDQDLPNMVEVCSEPLMNIIEGRLEKWPKSEKEAQDLCDSFITTEKCIREVGRKCAKGLHKTIISTLASAVQRSRKRECTKGKLPGIVKMTNCVEKNQVPMHNMMANITSRLLVIDNQFVNVDSKTNGVCCMVASIENEIKALYSTRCPTEGATIIRMYRAVLEDVIELICRQPKCNEVFKGYKIPKTKEFDGIISIMLRIVFSLGE